MRKLPFLTFLAVGALVAAIPATDTGSTPEPPSVPIPTGPAHRTVGRSFWAQPINFV